MTFWSLFIGGILLIFGSIAAAFPMATARALAVFPRNRIAAWILCTAGWLGAAYELDTIGIDVFDTYLKAFPYELWLLSLILIPLTCWWMGNLLAVRGAAAVLMLFPCEMFRATRIVDSNWRLVLVGLGYVCATVGMFAMFYPWRIRQALVWVAAKRLRVLAAGALSGVLGALISILGVIAR